ncbi:acyltransferase [Paenalcaligenes suwonensis]|uniref:acyltransferase n=1 Tax=Paenalcaligenes suwonensis TaxID=1202713 RepID=UPI00140CAD86|nr:acyltransferase family protein [Paenalcaligenes suwonensis]NHC60172.1 acyltransferase family protein [Paenalcaligenes suwonensis]
MTYSHADYAKLDTARWMAALAVVLLHSAAVPLTSTAAYGTQDWYWANLYDAATRWCVPIFVMVSGVLLLDPAKHEGFASFYKKRGRRILPAIGFWSVFYLFWGAWMYHQQGVPMDAQAWLRKATSGEPYYHLWYLYMLVGLYLFAPYLRLLYQHCSARQSRYVVLFMLVLAMLQSLYREVQGNSYGFFLLWFLPYISYFLAGRMMFEGRIRIPYPGWVLSLSIAATVVGTTLLSSHQHFSTYFYDTFSITVPLMSLAVFQLILQSPTLPTLPMLAPFTFGIYLVHPIFLDLAQQTGLYQAQTGIVWQTPLMALAVFMLSWLFAGLLRTLPGGTRIT